MINLVWSCAHGKYQEALLRGYERWSGAGLRGSAKDWGGRYASSRSSLFERVREKLPFGWDAQLQACWRWKGMTRLLIDAPDGTTYDWLSGEAITGYDIFGVDALEDVKRASPTDRTLIRNRALQAIGDLRRTLIKGRDFQRAYDASTSERQRVFVRERMLMMINELRLDASHAGAISEFLNALPNALREPARLALAERILAA